MKRIVCAALFMPLVVMALPRLFPVRETAPQPSSVPDKAAEKLEPDESRSISLLSGDTVVEIGVFDYLTGVVAAEMPVSFAQAALGAEIEVPTIDGRVKLTIPEGTQPGSVFRLRGKGIPYLQSKGGGRGDQFGTITVTVPKNMTSEQKERLRAYAEAMNESVSEGRSGIFGSKKKR